MPLARFWELDVCSHPDDTITFSFCQRFNHELAIVLCKISSLSLSVVQRVSMAEMKSCAAWVLTVVVRKHGTWLTLDKGVPLGGTGS
eukprot:5633172-Amphidinium_carterae.1